MVDICGHFGFCFLFFSSSFCLCVFCPLFAVKKCFKKSMKKKQNSNKMTYCNHALEMPKWNAVIAVRHGISPSPSQNTRTADQVLLHSDYTVLQWFNASDASLAFKKRPRPKTTFPSHHSGLYYKVMIIWSSFCIQDKSRRNNNDQKKKPIVYNSWYLWLLLWKIRSLLQS